MIKAHSSKSLETEKSMEEEVAQKALEKETNLRFQRQKADVFITRNREDFKNEGSQKSRNLLFKKRPKTVVQRKDFSNQAFFEKYIQEFEEIQKNVSVEDKKTAIEKARIDQKLQNLTKNSFKSKRTQSIGIYDYFLRKHEDKDLHVKFRKNAKRIQNYNRAEFLKETIEGLKKDEKIKHIVKYYTGNQKAIKKSQSRQVLVSGKSSKPRFEQTYEPSSYDTFIRVITEFDGITNPQDVVEKIRELVVYEEHGNQKAAEKLKRLREKINRIYWKNVRAPEYVMQIKGFLEKTPIPKGIVPKNAEQEKKTVEETQEIEPKGRKRKKSSRKKEKMLSYNNQPKKENAFGQIASPNLADAQGQKQGEPIAAGDEEQCFEIEPDLIKKARKNILSYPIKKTMEVFWLDRKRKKKKSDQEILAMGLESLRQSFKQEGKTESDFDLVDVRSMRQKLDIKMFEQRIEYDRLLAARKFSQTYLEPSGLDKPEKINEILKKNSEYIPISKENKNEEANGNKKKRVTHMRAASSQGTLLTKHSLGQNYCSRVNPYHAELNVQDSRRKFYEELALEKPESSRIGSGRSTELASRQGGSYMRGSNVESRLGSRLQSIKPPSAEASRAEITQPHLSEINHFLNEMDQVAQKVIESSNRSLGKINKNFSMLNERLSHLGKQKKSFDKRLTQQITKDIKHLYNERQNNCIKLERV